MVGPRRSAAQAAAAAADAHADALPRPLRKARGAWFTPWELALPTAMRALQPLLVGGGAGTVGSGDGGEVASDVGAGGDGLGEPRDGGVARRSGSVCGDGLGEPRDGGASMPTPSPLAPPLRIVDPAVGGGAFLRAALAVLREHGRSPASALAALHGVDVDGDAASLARAALCAEAGVAADTAAARALARQVRAGDGLRELPDGTFDCVLTNPPWETLQGDDGSPAANAALRAGFALQGRGKTYTYRLFVERALRLLRPGGRLGLIVPAGLWHDRDAEPLRRALLDQCEWEWLYGFENRRRLFAIDGRWRFGVVVATKGGATRSLRVAFGRVDAADWAAAQPAHARMEREAVAALSPGSGALVAVDDDRDLALLARMQRAGTPLLGPRSPLRWRQGDFNMTADRERFVRRVDAEAAGWARGSDGVWRKRGDAPLLPLLQGGMLHDLQPAAGTHAGGEGRSTTWTTAARPEDSRPLYLVDAEAWREEAAKRGPFRIAHRAIGNATNERTMLACLLPDLPCGNSLGCLQPKDPRAPLRTLAATAAALASLPFDYALRLRLSGANLNGFVLADCCLPDLADDVARELAAAAVRMCALLPQHGALWRQARDEGLVGAADLPARDAGERRALQTRIDALVGAAYGLKRDDVAWIVRGCGDGEPRLARGFWRVDRGLPVGERRPMRWLGVC